MVPGVTLSTDLYICEPMPARKVFDHALELLKRGVTFEPTWEHTGAGEGRGFDNAHYVTNVGQGLPAWLWVHYATDGPLRRYDDDDIGWAREDDPEWSPPWWNLHLLRVNVDTGYAYKTANGAGCADLHAWFVSEMWAWLSDQGTTRAAWTNEFTGEWFDSLTELHHFGDPVRGAL